MTKMSVLSKIASGVCVMFVSAYNTGCTPMRITQPMHSVDLDNFQIDCRIKEQQIKMLQSMRAGPDTQLINRLESTINPWDRLFNEEAAFQRQEIGRGRTDWLINQHLLNLRNNCGPAQ